MSYQSDSGNLLSFLAVVMAMVGFLCGVIGTRIPIFIVVALISAFLAMMCFIGVIIADERYSKKVKRCREEMEHE